MESQQHCMETIIDTETQTEYCENEEENINIEGNESLFLIGEDESPNAPEIETYVENIDNFINESLTSDFDKLQFKWNHQCSVCFAENNTFQDLLGHFEDYHMNSSNCFQCIFDDCEEECTNVEILAQHIILKHCEFLKNLQIYGVCVHCNLKFSNFVSFNQHSCYKGTKRSAGIQLHCKTCNIYFMSYKRFQFHMQFHQPSHRPMSCLICKENFSNIDNCFEHVMYEHDDEKTLTCRSCDRIFYQQDTFDIHMMTHEKAQKLNCDLCTARFCHPSQLKTHKEIVHGIKPKIENFNCDKCDQTFTSHLAWRQHSKTHENKNQVYVAICSNCGQIESDAEDLKFHIEIEDSTCFEALIEEELLETAYTCEYCGLDFRTKNNLQFHRDIGIHENEVFTCNFCYKGFNDFKSLSTHKKIHEQLTILPLNRLFLCDVDHCSEAYRDRIILQQHKRRSHRDKECIGCKKIFTGQNALDIHKEICTELPEDKNQCQFCKKTFFSKMSLSVHITRKHNNTNINCDICMASLKNGEAFEKHMETYHLACNCEFCGKAFVNKRSLYRHVKNFHPFG